MSTIKDKLYFNFDGEWSSEYGLMSISLNSGMYEETLFPTREIHKTDILKRETPIFHSMTEGLRGYELTLAFENKYTDEDIREIEDWLVRDYYKPLYFEGDEDRVMYCMLNGESNIVHTGLGEGYITFNIETNSPYLQSQEKMFSTTIDTASTLEVENKGSKKVYPQFSIHKNGDGDLRLGIDGRNVLIVNLKNNENIFIDTKKGIIKTDLIGQYRYDNIRAGELEDLYIDKSRSGNKEYKVVGGCEISCRFKEKYRF